jgi:hypothetical protein
MVMQIMYSEGANLMNSARPEDQIGDFTDLDLPSGKALGEDVEEDKGDGAD